MTVRFYSSVATEKTLVGTITSGQLTLDVNNTVGLPSLFPYTLALDYEAVNEELVNVVSAAGNTLTVDARGVDGTSASSHTNGARVRHVTSARDFADSRNHENSANGVHGLDVSEDLVGTNKIQTLSNKTVVDLQGTLKNVDFTNTPTNFIAITTTPAGSDTDKTIDLVNGSTRQFGFLNNGRAQWQNSVAMDTNDPTRRIQSVASDGTTERFYATAGGMFVSLPRPTSANTISAFKAIDPNDGVTRPMFTVRNSTDSTTRAVIFNSGHASFTGVDPAAIQMNVRGATAQSVPILRVDDSTGTAITSVTSTGVFDTRRGAIIGNTTTPAGVVLTVQGTNPGQTANLTEWYGASGTLVANVAANGTATFAVTTTTTGIITPAAGWTVSYQTAVRRAGMITINLALLRTGANITATSTGDLTADPFYGTLAGAFTPNTGFGTQLMPFIFTTDAGDGCAVVTANSGDIQLTSFSPTGTINTGATVRLLLNYPV